MKKSYMCGLLLADMLYDAKRFDHVIDVYHEIVRNVAEIKPTVHECMYFDALLAKVYRYIYIFI